MELSFIKWKAKLKLEREFNIHTGEYASLGDWYNNVKVKENEVELKNDYDGKSMVLRDVKGLDWIYITKEKNYG